MARVVSLARKVLRPFSTTVSRPTVRPGVGARDGDRSARRRTTIVVAAGPEDALHASAAALRRLGARITRYDSDDSALEARWKTPPASLSLRATIEIADTSRLDVETDAPRAPAVFRRLRAELARKGAP
jgi:hypothetical protein